MNRAFLYFIETNKPSRGKWSTLWILERESV